MSSETILLAAFAVFFTSFLSGVTGGGGGTLLLGLLLLLLDVPTAMLIFGVAMIVGVLSRLALWYRHIEWRILASFMPGALLTIAVLWFLVVVPPKWFLFLALGTLPFVSKYAPRLPLGDITTRRGAAACSIIITFIQMVAGAAGILLDRLFLNSSLDRKQIIATKSALLIFMHAIRIVYFGSIITATGEILPNELLFMYALIAMFGTFCATPVLRGISEKGFRRISEIVVSGVSLPFIARGVWLLI